MIGMQRGRRNRYVAIVVAVAVAIALFAAYVAYRANTPLSEYNSAMISYKKGEWVAATEKLIALGDYKDSKQILRELSQKPISEMHETLMAGDIVFFGMYGEQPLYWRVLATEKDNALLITEYLIEKRAKNADDQHRYWENSYVRSWLNILFSEQVFTREQWADIELYEIKTTYQGYDAASKIFLLDAEEADRYFQAPKDRAARYYYGGETGVWLLRAYSGDSKEYSGTFSVVEADGQVKIDPNYYSYYGKDLGIRPAIWVNVGGPSDMATEEPKDGVTGDAEAAASEGAEALAGADIEDGGEDPAFAYSLSKNPMVHDFGVLPEDGYPRGTWTVNRLIGKYGAPDDCLARFGRTFYDYERVSVSIGFPGLTIDFWHTDLVNEFTFYHEGLEAGEYVLAESDKDIEMEIFLLSITDPNAELPYGIKVRQSSRAEILDAYPEKDPYTYSDWEREEYFIMFNYAFYDEDGKVPDDMPYLDVPGSRIFQSGFIRYFFDESDILIFVEVQWWYSDI